MTRIGGAIVLAAAILIGIEVCIRRFAGVTVGGIDELSGYALAISSAWAFAFTLLQRAHVRIDTVYQLFPRPARAYLDLLALLVLGLFAATIVARASEMFFLAARFGSRSLSPLATPLWIPQGLWVAGWVVFAVVITLLFTRTLIALLSGRTDEALKVAGMMTIEEEVRIELADLKRRRTGS